MYFFTADQHFGHNKPFIYEARGFTSIEEHDTELIRRHNEVVKDGDVVVHAGDFTLLPRERAIEYVKQLNGQHIFLRGSHDRWLSNTAPTMWEKTIDGQHVVVCHYAMRTWGRSHYGSWNLFGHSHGKLEPIGKQWDVGVDNNNLYPVSWERVKEIMSARPDNPNV